MIVQVKYHALIKLLTGRDSEKLEFPGSEVTVKEFINELVKKYGGKLADQSSYFITINDKYVSNPIEKIREGDVVNVYPVVAGG